ncbi:hypothetical protein [Saccharothrix texasensis]|uniref:Major facilitator superfamily (MFS) profile domain-containing protein n=1 Tax=Saccharothrix texasensis TaxID=103734 RepID=A0A3N1HB53_9PSEU|nr:hypothetical protein [Saccharothrix texasensis]ROP39734.1 hypothetical protein EDD40_5131 [Saccharothrix texasensis]
MTQPPFDPYSRPMRPVEHPQAGPQPPYPSPHPGRMRDVDQHTAALPRPTAVVVSFVLWLLTALSWPVGSLTRTLAEDGAVTGFGPIMALFTSACLAVACVWGAVLLLGGSYHARLGLCGGALVIGVLALAAAIAAARDGDTTGVSWVVIVLRLALPAAASAFSFLPGTRQYFSGS